MKNDFALICLFLVDFGSLNIMDEALDFVMLKNADFVTSRNTLNKTINPIEPIASTYKNL